MWGKALEVTSHIAHPVAVAAVALHRSSEGRFPIPRTPIHATREFGALLGRNPWAQGATNEVKNEAKFHV